MSARINLFAALAGAIWGGVWMVIVGVMLMMVSGVIVSPPCLLYTSPSPRDPE